MDPTLDISAIANEEVKEEKGEIIFVQAGLWVLSGSIFGFIWAAAPALILAAIVPMVASYLYYKKHGEGEKE